MTELRSYLAPKQTVIYDALHKSSCEHLTKKNILHARFMKIHENLISEISQIILMCFLTPKLWQEELSGCLTLTKHNKR